MKKLQFLIPYGKSHAGGIRVIYDLASQLRSSGFDVSVYQFGKSNVTNGSGFDDSLLVQYIDKEAHLVIPDAYLTRISSGVLKDRNYSSLIQNPYILFNLKRFGVESALNNLLGSTNIFVISKDTENIINNLGYKKKVKRIKWSLDQQILKNALDLDISKKIPLISYMPRKCLFQVPTIELLLREKLKRYGFSSKPIKNVSFHELINQLVLSKVFISLSEFEGFAAPPVEASVLGNIVVGYHGNGNRELFDLDNFHGIESGDIVRLVNSSVDYVLSYEEKYDESVRLKLITNFEKNYVTDYNVKAFCNADFEPTELDGKCLKLPNNSVSILLDRALTKYYQLS